MSPTSIHPESLWLALKIISPIVIALFINRIVIYHIHVPAFLDTPRFRTYASAIQGAFTTMVYIIAIYYIFILLDFNVTPLFASAGLIGVIVALGIRPLLEDFFTGVLILTQDTINVGDYVKIGDTEGVTETVGLRTVRIRDQNGAIHIITNREIKKIINYSRRKARVVIDVPIKTNQPIDQIFTVFNTSVAKLRKDPDLGTSVIEANVQGVNEIRPGQLIIRVRILTKTSNRWLVERQFNYLLLKECKKSKILLA